jgi:ketosteroid isomerase-like protein
MKNATALICLLLLTSAVSRARADDTQSKEEVRARLDAFNRAWMERDMSFIRDFYAHDDNLLAFFERRQLHGFDDVETLYETMFAHARPNTVHSSYSNLVVDARGDMAYVAANFRLEAENPEGETMTDTGRVTVVLERRDNDWVAVHRHTSFQAPPGPQRQLPLHTEPGPLWKPTLQGAWRSDKGATLIATATYIATKNVSGLPDTATYRIAEEGLWLTPDGGAPGRARLVEVARLSGSELVLRLPSGAYTFRRME